MALHLLQILFFPGFFFLGVFGMAAEFIDRKLHARLQNRIGPPWFQPLADFIKLSSKEVIIPERADPLMFTLMPILALASTVTASFSVPMWSVDATFSFEGDMVVVLYLLTITTLTMFLGGYYSTSIFSRIGAIRSVTQMLAYEVPLFIALLGPAILAHTWSLSKITEFYVQNPRFWILSLPILPIVLIALLGKLEKVPFDIPEAETEIVAGPLTEYSGRLLAMFRLALSIETVVALSIVASVVFPFGYGLGFASFVIFVIKVTVLLVLLTLLRTVFARLRIDQMVNFCWKYLAPASIAMLLIFVIVKEVFD
jgi:NADH-quinone oxidoreductase subunit H